ncbi:uncharacterized protein At3g49055 isoform X2 [Cryptomeria japonica]|uniref:uncharacterized protein At3g49055 isoform X2 n=1 Tax=Cryptomeria japonica TaxID=3369 RepID=UPI0025AC9F1D|nr:uncharacterized protein At3g49055 isoform X2 [Cryptomeria japonica]
MDISRERDFEDVFRENEEVGQILHETPIQGEHLRTQMESQNPILTDISKAQECLDNLLNMMRNDPKPDQSEKSELISQLKPISDELCIEGSSLEACLDRVRAVSKLAASAEAMFKENQQNTWKEKKELENSIISLTEENRDISTLLRSALAEKEAVEKAFSKSKAGGAAAIFQIAERGLQRVGFGFKVETGGKPTTPENDSNEGEEDAFSLASTMENIVKSMRREITELRQTLEASREEVNNLREFSASQAQDLAKNKLRVKELEEREIALTENVEVLMKDIAVAEEDITRWRKACELEAEAGKTVMEECQAELCSTLFTDICPQAGVGRDEIFFRQYKQQD